MKYLNKNKREITPVCPYIDKKDLHIFQICYFRKLYYNLEKLKKIEYSVTGTVYFQNHL